MNRLPVSNARWMMLGFAFLATVINYLDRQTLSVLAPVLLERFRISATTYSHIIFAFMLAYTVMNGVSGPLLDRLGTKIGYALTIAWWSAAEILHAFSSGAISLEVFRCLLGMGEAGNFPAGVKLIGEWFPPKERSLASGIFNSGAAIGAMLAPPLLALTVLQMGWQASFVVVGSLGFVWLGAWWIFYRNPGSSPEEVETPPPAVWPLAKSRFVWQFTLSKVFADPVWYFYTFWFPQYLKVGHGFTMKQIGETAWIPFFTAGIGNLAGGFVCRLAHTARIVAADGSPDRSAHLFGADDGSSAGGNGSQSIACHCAHLHGNFWLLWSSGERPCDSTRLISEECGGLDLGPGKYGFRIRWNVL